MLLKEILNMQAQPFTWLDDEKCIFELSDKSYGVIAKRIFLTLNDGLRFSAVNISFGILKSDNFKTGNDLDLNLTNFGKIRTVMSTIAEACLANEKIINADVICLASDDSKKEKRTSIYSIALAEIRDAVKTFDDANDIIVKTKYEAILVLLSKIKFSEEQKQELSERLDLAVK